MREVWPARQLEADTNFGSNVAVPSRAQRTSRRRATETVADAPRSSRGARTRAAIVAAAKDVFERDGFLDARVTDIAEAANVAHGSFYTYFRTKAQVLAAVLSEIQEEMLQPGVRDEPQGDPAAAIEAANRAYLLAYQRNARMMAVLDQVAAIDDEMRRVRLERNRVFAERNAASIERLQRAGLADPALDPVPAAMAMGGMVSRMANLVFVHGYPLEMEELVDVVTRLWVNALGIRPPKL
jgi:AcrR family transcriptional regulator